MEKKTFNILAIDGGGIRGIFPAYILQCLQERIGVEANKAFNMFAGTSTGAIIAAGIACGKAPSEMVSLYQQHGHEIFGKAKRSFLPKKLKQGFHSKYCNQNLKDVLLSTFKDVRLGDIKKPLLLPATDIGNGGVHVFKSGYNSHFTRDNSVAVRDALLASCSAPAFFDPTQVGRYLLADGGVWANNPALAAVIDARYRLNVALEDIRVLSLGTGESITAYGTKKRKRWGLITGWKGVDFIGFLLSLQAQSTQNYLKLMLDKEQLLRLNFKSDQPLPLDDVDLTDDLISKADLAFTRESEPLKMFFNKD
ncbi:MAG TPA: patatin [Rhodobacteraceae bacterium]|nr:patatin [Paracoccaceae bacterium]